MVIPKHTEQVFVTEPEQGPSSAQYESSFSSFPLTIRIPPACLASTGTADISVSLRRAVSARREHLLEYAQLGRGEFQIVLRNAQPYGALQFLVGRGAAGGAAEPE